MTSLFIFIPPFSCIPSFTASKIIHVEADSTSVALAASPPQQVNLLTFFFLNFPTVLLLTLIRCGTSHINYISHITRSYHTDEHINNNTLFLAPHSSPSPSPSPLFEYLPLLSCFSSLTANKKIVTTRQGVTNAHALL